MENQNTYSNDGYELELLKYIDMHNQTKDEVIYKLVLNDRAFNSYGLMDEGLLIALIDSYSSFASHIISNFNKNDYALSMNIKMTSIESIKPNTDYFMKVKISEENKNTILFEIQICDGNGKLIKKASHLKKKIKPKF